jgi:hypothetical protein
MAKKRSRKKARTKKTSKAKGAPILLGSTKMSHAGLKKLIKFAGLLAPLASRVKAADFSKLHRVLRTADTKCRQRSVSIVATRAK